MTVQSIEDKQSREKKAVRVRRSEEKKKMGLETMEDSICSFPHVSSFRARCRKHSTPLHSTPLHRALISPLSPGAMCTAQKTHIHVSLPGPTRLPSGYYPSNRRSHDDIVHNHPSDHQPHPPSSMKKALKKKQIEKKSQKKEKIETKGRSQRNPLARYDASPVRCAQNSKIPDRLRTSNSGHLLCPNNRHRIHSTPHAFNTTRARRSFSNVHIVA